MSLLIRIGVVAAVVAAILLAISTTLVSIHVDRVWGGLVHRIDPAQHQVEQQAITITNVNVLSENAAEMLPARTVIIEDGLIVSVSDTGNSLETGHIVDGTGLYLIPGLVDTHVHLRRQPNDLLLYLAFGVTHVREMSGSTAILEWRDEISRGDRVGPSITVSSPLLYTTSRIRGWFRAATEPRRNVISPEAAASVVRRLSDAGYDELKLYADIDSAVFRAVNAAAIEEGLHTSGHLPFDFTIDQLSTMGMREIAHVEELVKKLQDEFDPEVDGLYAEAFPAYVADRSDEVIDQLIENDITVNTTLWLMEVIGRQAFDLESQLRDIPLEYANPGMIEGSPYIEILGWLPGRNAFEESGTLTIDARDRIEASWEARAEAHRILFRRMVERGVRLTAGTDATSHLMIPGFSMHQELQSLVNNGMSPSQALRAAGSVPADMMSLNSGAIAPGLNADLVLLSGNPLENIANTRTVQAVIANGRLFDREALDRMLESVERANNESRSMSIEELL